MARYIDYDKLHDELCRKIYPKFISESSNQEELIRTFNAIMTCIEMQDTVEDWDERKRLLQPKRSSFDWGLFHEEVNTAVDYMQCNLRDGKKRDWSDAFRNWLADFMFCYDLSPSELLMEDNNDE